MFRGVEFHSECAGDVQKRFPNKFGNFKISRLFDFFHPESQIHIRLGDLKGSELVGKHVLRFCGAPRVRRGCVGTIPGQVWKKLFFEIF